MERPPGWEVEGTRGEEAGVLPDEYEQGQTAAHQRESLPDHGAGHNRVVGRLARPTEAQPEKGFHPTGRRR